MISNLLVLLRLSITSIFVNKRSRRSGEEETGEKNFNCLLDFWTVAMNKFGYSLLSLTKILWFGNSNYRYQRLKIRRAS